MLYKFNFFLRKNAVQLSAGPQTDRSYVSEDLDFTLVEEATNDQIFSWFREMFAYVREEANIPLDIVDNNQHEDRGINFYISYVGPLAGIGSNKRIKIDIARSEQLEFKAW